MGFILKQVLPFFFFLARWPPPALGLEPTNVKSQNAQEFQQKSQNWISVLILWGVTWKCFFLVSLLGGMYYPLTPLEPKPVPRVRSQSGVPISWTTWTMSVCGVNVERIHKEYQDVIRNRSNGCHYEKILSLEWIKLKLTIAILFPTKFPGPVKFLWSHDFGSSYWTNCI